MCLSCKKGFVGSNLWLSISMLFRVKHLAKGLYVLSWYEMLILEWSLVVNDRPNLVFKAQVEFIFSLGLGEIKYWLPHSAYPVLYFSGFWTVCLLFKGRCFSFLQLTWLACWKCLVVDGTTAIVHDHMTNIDWGIWGKKYLTGQKKHLFMSLHFTCAPFWGRDLNDHCFF